MKRFIAAASLLGLSACISPQQQCIVSASAEYDGLVQQAAIARENINRGYAVHSQQVPYTYASTCYDTYGQPYPCTQTSYRTEETPVAIDVSAERQKLAATEAKIPAAKARRDAAVAQCRVTYPE